MRVFTVASPASRSSAGCIAAQVEATMKALELTTEAIEQMVEAQLPLSIHSVQEAEAHLFRAQACLAAILSNSWKTGAGDDEEPEPAGIGLCMSQSPA